MLYWSSPSLCPNLCPSLLLQQRFRMWVIIGSPVVSVEKHCNVVMHSQNLWPRPWVDRFRVWVILFPAVSVEGHCNVVMHSQNLWPRPWTRVHRFQMWGIVFPDLVSKISLLQPKALKLLLGIVHELAQGSAMSEVSTFSVQYVVIRVLWCYY